MSISRPKGLIKLYKNKSCFYIVLLTFYSLAVSLRTARFNIQKFYMVLTLCCFVRISEQTAAFALYVINWLVFITIVESVYCAVWTGSLNKPDYISSLKD